MLLLWLFLQSSYGQNKILPYALNYLSNTLGTQIKASKIKVSFFDEFQLDDVLVYDSEGDTLLYIQELNTDIGLFSFFSKQLTIDELSIKDASINLTGMADGKYNFSHILDHLNADKSKKSDKDADPWDISLGFLNIENTEFRYLSNGSTISSTIPTLKGDFSAFSINESVFELNSLDINGIVLKYDDLGIQKTEDLPIEIPKLPFSLLVKKLSINGKTISYNKSIPIISNAKFDPNHIHLENLNLKGSNFIWKDSFFFDLSEMNFKLNEGFELINLSSNLFLSEQKLSLENTKLKTGTSNIELSGTAEYNNFNVFLKDFLNTNSKFDIQNAVISKTDINYFFSKDAFATLNIKALNDIVLKGAIDLNNGNLSTENISLSSGKSFSLKGSTKSYNLSNSNPSHSFNITQLSTSQSFLSKLLPTMKFPPELNDLGNISGTFKGNITSNVIKFDAFSIHSNKGTSLAGYGKIFNYQTGKTPEVEIYFKNLKTNINSLLTDTATIPAGIRRLQDIEYVGMLKGNLSRIYAKGKLSTSLGDLELDAESQFNDTYTEGNYNGYFNLQDFDLGYMLNDTMLGIANFEGNLTGSGLTLESIKATIDGTIKSFCYDGYIYQDITVNGSFQDSVFDGRIISKDEYFNFDIEGKINLKGSTSALDITMNLKNLDLKELGLTDNNLILGGTFYGNLQGNSIDDFIGNAFISGLSIQTDKGSYLADSIVSLNVTEINESAKIFNIDSPFFEGEIKGKIKPSKLIRFVKNYIKAYIPLEIGYDENVEDNLDKYFEENEDQNFIFSAKTKDINPFLEPLFGKDFTVKKATIGAYFSSQETRLDIKGKIDSLLYKGILFQRGSYFFDGRKSFINGNANIEDISMDNEILVPITTINTILNNKVANFDLVMSDEKDVERLNLSGDLTRTDEYIVSFENSIFLSGSNWNISPYNQIIFGDYGLYMQDVKLSKDNQAITVYTDKNENGEAIEVLFDDFILSDLTSIIDKENEYFEGKIDGSLVINSLYSKPFITANLNLKNITISGHQAGTLSVQAAQDIATNSVNSNIRLFGPQNDASMILAYGIEDQSTKGELDVQKLEMAVIDPYLTDLFIRSEGFVSGKILINGDLNNLDLKGKLRTHNVSTTPVFTNSRYKISDTDIAFSDTEIDFDTVQLKDKNDNSAFVSGKIYHKNLRNSIVDLKVSTKSFEFLNTTSTENELFYGHVNVSGNATIYGPIDNIEIDGAVSAVDNSKLNVSPLSIESEFLADDFILYGGDPREIPFDSLRIEVKKPKIALPFKIDIKVNVENDSEFSLILNPITGDKLTCHGNSNLILKLSKAGEMELFGTYTVTQGVYTFSYGIISKGFKIQPGSTVTLNGDPLNGLLNVNAIYVANTSVYDLIKLESDLSDSQKSEAQRNRDINVVLNLTDYIMKPNITLDITTDDNGLSSISDILTRKLQQLRSEPDELNNQVFGLLLFNNFILARNAETDLAKTGTDIAIRSISGLISSQLNKLADGIMKGFEVNFDFNSYSSDFLAQGEEGVITELGLGVKQSLIDDRLTISAGTNINLETSSKTSEFSTLAGDFVLEYKLNKDGNYIIKAFRKSSFDRLIDENSSKNGASFFIRKEFGTIKKTKD